MDKIIPIETVVGFLTGRDCVYLDKVTQDVNSGVLVFEGDINGNLVVCEKEWLPYKLKFTQVLMYFCCELDTYGNLTEIEYSSSFDLVENSTWLEALPIRKDYDKKEYKHYRLFTYDDVFDVIATGYEFELI